MQKLEEKQQLGEAFKNHSQKQRFLDRYVNEYSDRAWHALKSSDIVESRAMELRQTLRGMNDQFAYIMRQVGQVWAFEDRGVHPHTVSNSFNVVINNSELSEVERSVGLKKVLEPVTYSPDAFTNSVSGIQAFDDHKSVKSLNEFRETIKHWLGPFGAVQPPGVINSAIYPFIYRLQVVKWAKIAQEHLERVKTVIKNNYKMILMSVCPDEGRTSLLHHEIDARLNTMFAAASSKAKDSLQVYCKEETEAEFPLSTSSEFGEQIEGWRYLRFFRAYFQGAETSKHSDDVGNQNVYNVYNQIWRSVNLSGQDRMINDIHDVVKVSYEVRADTKHIMIILA